LLEKAITETAKPSGRAADTLVFATQHVRMNHRRADVLATSQHPSSDGQGRRIKPSPTRFGPTHRRALSNAMAAGALTSKATSRTERAGLRDRREVSPAVAGRKPARQAVSWFTDLTLRVLCRADRHAQPVGTEGLHQALAQAVGPGHQGQQGLEPRSVPAAGQPAGNEVQVDRPQAG